MNDETRELLAILAGLNMGKLYLKLTSTMRNGALDPDQLRYVADVFDDTASLLRTHADKVNPPAEGRPLVIDVET
ncbi:MAG: hypothetical protein GEU86_19830 [Actinophytocola sp.]|nr:hypothetical protein [Actinophytocola sp.]